MHQCGMYSSHFPTVDGDQRKVRPREEMLRECWYLIEGGSLCTKQVSQRSRFCTAISPSTESTALAGLYTTDHLHLSFKSSPASSGRRRTGPPVYVYRVFDGDKSSSVALVHNILTDPKRKAKCRLHKMTTKNGTAMFGVWPMAQEKVSLAVQ